MRSSIQSPVVTLMLLSLSSLVAACGGTAMREQTNAQTGSGGTGGWAGGGTPSPLPSTSPTPTATPTPSFTPMLSFAFTLGGVGATNPKPTQKIGPIQTDSILKVRFVPESAGQNPNSGFTANYGCISYSIGMGGQGAVQNSGLLALPGLWQYSQECYDAPNSKILDLSGQLQPGHGDVFLTISEPRTDFYCRDCFTRPYAYGGNCSYYCPSRPVYINHVVRGTLEVMTNRAGI